MLEFRESNRLQGRIILCHSLGATLEKLRQESVTGVANGPSKSLGLANFSRISRVSLSCFFSGFVRLAVSQSRVFAIVSLRVSKSQFVCLFDIRNDVFSSLDIEFQ